MQFVNYYEFYTIDSPIDVKTLLTGFFFLSGLLFVLAKCILQQLLIHLHKLANDTAV